MGLIEILLGVVFTVCIGLGLGLGAMGDAGNVEFWVARAAFVVAAVAIAGAFFFWLSEGERENRLIVLLGTLAGMWVFVGLPFQLKWVDVRAEKIRALNTPRPPLIEPTHVPSPITASPPLIQPAFPPDLSANIARLVKVEGCQKFITEIRDRLLTLKDSVLRFQSSERPLVQSAPYDVTLAQFRDLLDGIRGKALECYPDLKIEFNALPDLDYNEHKSVQGDERYVTDGTKFQYRKYFYVFDKNIETINRFLSRLKDEDDNLRRAIGNDPAGKRFLNR